MVHRIKCRRVFCFRSILEQTSKDNGGLCGRCFRRSNPTAWKKLDPNTRYEKELTIPANQLTDRQKRRQLQGTFIFGNEKRTDELLSFGTTFLKKPKSRFTTWLGEAISQDCSLLTLDKLFAAGCDPNSCSKSPDHTCPLEVAIQENRVDAMEWLISHGADPNLGRPIVGAINYTKPPDIQIKMLSILLDAGADVNKTFALYGDENDRFTVLDWALLYDVSPSVVEYLEQKGAKHHYSSERVAKMKLDLKSRRIVP